MLWSLLVGLFRSRASLEDENPVLRQQIIVLRRTAPKRWGFNVIDGLIFVGLYQLFPVKRANLQPFCRSPSTAKFGTKV